MLNVKIYHNVTESRVFGTSYEDKDVLQEVFEFEVTEYIMVFLPQDFMQSIFKEFNIGTGPLALMYQAMRLRSLSVGDVVKLDKDGVILWYMCEPTGWNFYSHLKPNIVLF